MRKRQDLYGDCCERPVIMVWQVFYVRYEKPVITASISCLIGLRYYQY